MTTPIAGMSRRTFLQASTAAASLAAVSRPVAASAQRAHTPPGQLVVVFLRGGQDHLSAVVPYTDDNYYRRRPTIAVPADAVLRLDDTFGLHPAIPGLHDMYTDGRLAVVVGAGNPAGDRSHFVAQDLWEYGDVDVPADGHGWLGRYLTSTSASGDSLFRGITLGNNVNLSLRGFPALGIASVAHFGLGGFSTFTASSEPVLRKMHPGDSRAHVTGIATLDAAAQVESLDGSSSEDDTGRMFADTAELLDSDLGVEVITLNIGHWDTHDAMGSWDDGEMRSLLTDFDTQLTVFQEDLDRRGRSNVTTVVMTEFGRRIDENGSGGTDHGWGSAMYVLGGGVNGGRVFGSIPKLDEATTAPHRHEVPVTTDCRDVLGEVAGAALGANAADLFLGHRASHIGVMN